MVAVMLLAGCLSYSNSAMNPILYAFLSENFKKSFMKACTCANRFVKGFHLHAHFNNSLGMLSSQFKKVNVFIGEMQMLHCKLNLR